MNCDRCGRESRTLLGRSEEPGNLCIACAWEDERDRMELLWQLARIEQDHAEKHGEWQDIDDWTSVVEALEQVGSGSRAAGGPSAAIP